MNRYSDDDELNAALEEDAAKLEAMGQSAGITLQDLDFEAVECPACEGKAVEEARIHKMPPGPDRVEGA